VTSIKPIPDLQSPGDGETPTPRRTWLRRLLGVVVLAVVLLVVVQFLPAATKTQEEAIAGSVDRLVIDVTGAVSLVAGDHTELVVTKEWVLAGEPTVTVSHDGGDVHVNGECPWFQVRCTTSVSGTVAVDAVIVVTTSAGSIEVRGTTGGVDLETSAGSVHVEDVTGAARLHTSAGSILGTVTDGNVEAETSLGRIELAVFGDFSSLVARTSAGSVDLTVTDEVYDIDADTSAGSVNVSVRTDPSATRRIVAESSAGSITISPGP